MSGLMNVDSAPSTCLDIANKYVALGWSLAPMDSGTKGPNRVGWNLPANLIQTPQQAIESFGGAARNMGLVHRPSGTCAIDVDNEAWARHILEQFGIDYDDVMGRGLRIVSKANRDK